MELKDIKKAHLVGDRGISMQGLKQVLESRGVEVTGCDIASGGHDPAHITSDIDLVLYSSAITPESSGFAELQVARKQKIAVNKRAWLAGRLMQEKGKIGMAISGMHGKSTTTAMVGAILEEAGEDPLVLGGAILASSASSVRLGKGKYVVVEADEYDRSFHELMPQVALVLNIEPEHLDYYSKGLPEIIRAFREFIKLVPKNGVVVINKDDNNAQMVSKSAKAKVAYFSVKKPWPGLHLKVWGKHNLTNATAAGRVCHELGISSKIIKKALNNFSGVARRMEHKATLNGVQVYDDYAHHPTEIKATLQAAREHFGKRRIIVVFEPHQFSRTKLLFENFVQSFSDADVVLVAPIYGVAGRDQFKDVSSENLAQNIKGPSAKALDYNQILDWLSANTASGDVVLTMGAGPINTLGEKWISLQHSKQP